MLLFSLRLPTGHVLLALAAALSVSRRDGLLG